MRTAQQLIDKVLEIVKERPDTVYTPSSRGCLYMSGSCSDGSVGCLLGQAMVALGWINEEPDLYSEGIPDVLNSLGVIGEGKQVDLLAEIQVNQDGGSPWKKAVEDAMEMEVDQ